MNNIILVNYITGRANYLIEGSAYIATIDISQELNIQRKIFFWHLSRINLNIHLLN